MEHPPSTRANHLSTLPKSQAEADALVKEFETLINADEKDRAPDRWRQLDCAHWLDELKGDKRLALLRFKDSVSWKLALDMNGLRAEHCRAQLELQKIQVLGPDNNGRGVVVLRGCNHKPGVDMLSMTETVMYVWEQALSISTSERREVTAIYELEGCGRENSDLRGIKFLIEAYMANYPGTLHVLYVTSTPWYFRLLWNIVRHSLTKELAQRVELHSNRAPLHAVLDASKIPKYLDGTSPVDCITWFNNQVASETAADGGSKPRTCSEHLRNLLSDMSVARARESASQSGWLKKQGGFVARFNDRYTCLCGKILYYFLDEGDTSAEGVMDLVGAWLEPLPKGDKGNGFVIVTPAGKRGIFHANNKKDADAWHAALTATGLCERDASNFGNPTD